MSALAFTAAEWEGNVAAAVPWLLKLPPEGRPSLLLTFYRSGQVMWLHLIPKGSRDI